MEANRKKIYQFFFHNAKYKRTPAILVSTKEPKKLYNHYQM